MLNDDQPQTPPLSSSPDRRNATPSSYRDKEDMRHVTRSQHVLSPLTLGELGLHPPSSPGALLDITTPLSFGISEPSGDLQAAKSEQAQHHGSDTRSDGSDTNAIGLKVSQKDAKVASNSSQHLSAAPTSATVASPASFQDPFLASFLQNLSEDPLKPQQDSTDDPVAARATLPMSSTVNELVALAESRQAATDPQAIPMFDASGMSIRSDQAIDTSSLKESPTRLAETPAPTCVTGAVGAYISGQVRQTVQGQFLPARTSASSYCHPYWVTSHQASSSSQPAQSQSVSIAPHCGTTSAQTSNSVAPYQDEAPTERGGLLPFGSESFRVTSVPLQKPSTTLTEYFQSAAPPSVSAASVNSSTEAALATGTSVKTKAPVPLIGIPPFLLPPAPPLQVELARRDSRYKLDSEKDGRSDPGKRASRSRDSADSGQTIRQPFPSGMTPSAEDCKVLMQAKPPSSMPPSSVPQRMGASDALGAVHAPLQTVALSRIVRPRSFSTTSESSLTTQEALLRLPDFLQAAEKNASCRLNHAPAVQSKQSNTGQSQVCVGSASSHARSPHVSASIKSLSSQASSRASHDFTRQALLDFIRRTNLGMASNTPEDRTIIAPSSKAQVTSPERTAGSEAPCIAGMANPSRWSSDEPKELQADLQAQQHQSKRQKVQSEIISESEPEKLSSMPSGCSTTSEAHVRSAHVQADGNQRRVNKRKGSGSEQEDKLHKQEQYQRLLRQLQSQMRLKMQMQKQKQKEMQDKMTSADPSDQQDGRQNWENSNEASSTEKPARVGRSGSVGSRRDSVSAECATLSDDSVFVKPSAAVRSSKRNDDGCRRGRPGSSGGSRRDSCSEEGQTQSQAAACDGPKLGVADLSPANPSTAIVEGIYLKPIPVQGTSMSSLWPVPKRYDQALVQNAIPSGLVSASHGSAWQGNETPWYSNNYTAFSGSRQTNLSSVWGSSPAAFLPSWLDPSSSRIATDLITEHPNWLRAMEPPTLVPLPAAKVSFANDPPPMHARYSSPLSISAATGLSSANTSNPQLNCIGTGRQAKSSEGSRIKRPFSPGEKVVFWAVKGDYSVKLVGTVESVSAFLSVPPQQA